MKIEGNWTEADMAEAEAYAERLREEREAKERTPQEIEDERLWEIADRVSEHFENMLEPRTERS